ncbi:MAG: hypothetical protein AB8E15_02005 [Bdellovibrionales bacterium]
MRWFFAVLTILFFSEYSYSEPWVSNRFAQNCAGCHDPGRVNRFAKDRRCTLSCQGCHVNPNGGGMRSHYGKYNEERWLYTLGNKGPLAKGGKGTPLPYQKQLVTKYLEGNKLSSKKHRKIRAKKKVAKRFLAKNKKKIISEGLPVKYRKNLPRNEKAYDKYHDTRWNINNKIKHIDMATMGPKDPYRLTRKEWFTPHAEARFFYISKSDSQDSANDINSLSWMAFDLGGSIRPFKKQNNVAFVFESRYYNGPTNTQWDEVFNNNYARSAYVLWDDLPYNSYVQYGLFRPMFGHYNPDHNTLFQQMTGLRYLGTKKALGFGASPNVPFFNINLITPEAGASSADSGIVATFGGRFVTLGLSMGLSYWNTTSSTSGIDIDLQMIAVDFGSQIGDFTINFNGTKFDSVDPTKTPEPTENGGFITTLEGKYRFYRETYAMLSYSNSNTAKDFTPGAAQQVGFGVKSFLYPGVETEFYYYIDTETDEDNTDPDSTENLAQLQLHVYF